MTSQQTLEQKLSNMAEALVDAAMSPGQELASKEAVDVFKAVTAWYLGIRKVKKDEPDEPPVGGTFDDIIHRVNGAAS